MGVFARIFEGLAAEAPETPTIMIAVSLRTLCVRVSLHKYFKAYRTASSLRGKGGGAIDCHWLEGNGECRLIGRTKGLEGRRNCPGESFARKQKPSCTPSSMPKEVRCGFS